MKAHIWRCPSCSEPLTQTNKQWRCVNGHSFDCAKEGYVNLLLAQNKNSKAPGDSKLMVNARRVFLRSGHYKPLVDALVRTINENEFGDKQYIFDAGCGEGYYLDSILSQLAPTTERHVCGIDISKAAIAKAAKSHKNTHFAVASTYSIPLFDNTQNLALQMFAPSAQDDILRVLKEGGLWIRVNPGPMHLFEMKSLVYDTPQRHNVDYSLPDGFERVSDELVSFDFQLSQLAEREALLQMTPFYWQTSEEKKQKLKQSLLSVHAEFSVQVFRCKKQVSDSVK